jgi:hypothetical protein
MVASFRGLIVPLALKNPLVAIETLVDSLELSRLDVLPRHHCRYSVLEDEGDPIRQAMRKVAQYVG